MTHTEDYDSFADAEREREAEAAQRKAEAEAYISVQADKFIFYAFLACAAVLYISWYLYCVLCNSNVMRSKMKIGGLTILSLLLFGLLWLYSAEDYPCGFYYIECEIVIWPPIFFTLVLISLIPRMKSNHEQGREGHENWHLPQFFGGRSFMESFRVFLAEAVLQCCLPVGCKMWLPAKSGNLKGALQQWLVIHLHQWTLIILCLCVMIGPHWPTGALGYAIYIPVLYIVTWHFWFALTQRTTIGVPLSFFGLFWGVSMMMPMISAMAYLNEWGIAAIVVLWLCPAIGCLSTAGFVVESDRFVVLFGLSVIGLAIPFLLSIYLSIFFVAQLYVGICIVIVDSKATNNGTTATATVRIQSEPAEHSVDDSIGDTWTGPCGRVNVPSSKFCTGCGTRRSTPTNKESVIPAPTVGRNDEGQVVAP
jgi:hypothetical protein